MTNEKSPAGILAQIDFFSSFFPGEIEQILAKGDWIKAASGQTLIDEGADDAYLYVLVRGLVNVVKNGKVLAQLEAGDSFGEIGALARTPRTATVRAHGECYCLRFGPRQIDSLPTDVQLKLVKTLLYSLASRLTSANRRLVI